ncbi:PVC-type heme-binding CxxCH protein [Aureliella helgolandensis]|uniref:Cytochrome c n=1 Tax=Aureliella helgolandensis TaxID=2527968 RepID=A0A518G971_9BACT|nr:PVC-type heme-binding CxxCH protein [Aureliella helgolandensis]QDV25136.1 Cytochrome c [Aureliella helgolandensis]
MKYRLLLWTSLLVGSTIGPARAQEDYGKELPRIPATEPAQALASFEVADGFEIEQVAAEPLIASPVAIQWDATGGMFVCEMRGYSEDREAGISRITRLTDKDQDGIYDHSQIFADQLFWPTAIFPFDGGLFVGDAPNIFYFKDTDGDGVADSKQLVLTGFGTSNVQGLLNSFHWGLDNRIHVACSSVGGKVRRSDQAESEAIDVRGRDIAFDPRTFEFELTSGAAQHGMTFDDWGRKFVSSNSDHIQQVMYEDRYIGRNPWLSPPPSRMSIAADGPQATVFRRSPVEPWRIVRTRLRVNGTVRGIVEGGGRPAGYFTGATGVTIVRGDLWPQEMQGTAIVGDVGSNLIHRKRLEVAPGDSGGLQFVAERIDDNSEFVASTDIWFRPAQFENGPDGALYAVDVCREVIEHPASLPPEIKQHLDLTSGRDRGRIYRIAPQGAERRAFQALKQLTTAELVHQLTNPNAWQRETASRLLWERQDHAAIAPLRQLTVSAEMPQARLHALHALAGLDGLDAPILLTALQDPHSQLRKHAILLVEQALPELQKQVDIAARLIELAGDDSIEVRYQLAFSVGSLQLEQKTTVLEQLILRDVENRWMRAAVQSSLAQDAGPLFATLIENPDFRSPAAGGFLKDLAKQITAQNSEPELKTVVGVLPQLPPQDAPFALPILGEFLAGQQRSGSLLAKWAEAGELQDLDHTLNRMLSTMRPIATSQTAALPARIAAIDALRYGSYAQAETTLAGLLDHRQPSSVQHQAIRTLGSFANRQVSQPIIAAWPTLSPQLREAASEVLFSRPELSMSLFDAIDAKRIAITDISPARIKLAAESKDKQVRTRASQYVGTSGTEDRQEVIAAYQESLKSAGTADRGKQIFEKHCASCHRLNGVGHEIGPSLSAMKSRGADAILSNVLAPNMEVNPQYLNYILLNEDGQAMTGMISAESATSITLKRAEAATDTVLRVDIDSLKSTGQSIMPEGFEKSIDPQQMADLIAYILGSLAP